MATETYIGKGSIYLEEVGGTTGLLPVGNAPKLEFGFEEDKKSLQDFESEGGGEVDSVSIITGVTGAATLNSFSIDNLTKLLRGTSDSDSGGMPSSTETSTAYHGALVLFGQLASKSVAITVTNVGATTTYVEGTDYSVKNTGILILADGSITDGSDIEVSYTTAAQMSVEALTSSAKKYRLVFDGLNDADGGSPIRVEAFIVKLDPVSTMALITEDFAAQELTFSVIKDETKTGAGKSKYFIAIKQ
ncbi:MAG: hypothetical protein GY829_04465 [Gammaproteobacteria bacterium]|nr:hypothetical protein [Gammaproteobacteria bacterium]MCP4881121.1 hypothetical protein [Gammaproteobacteria bacterium]